MLQPATAPPAVSNTDRLKAVYQLKIHLLGIRPQISRRVLVRGGTTPAELPPVFQVVMGWGNWHLHSFHLWGKNYGISYAGGTWFIDDARRVCEELIERLGLPDRRATAAATVSIASTSAK